MSGKQKHKYSRQKEAALAGIITPSMHDQDSVAIMRDYQDEMNTITWEKKEDLLSRLHDDGKQPYGEIIEKMENGRK